MWIGVSPQDLSVREALSGITGSISLASWILLLVPQLLENFKNGSADGVSTAFLLTWFLGDIANLAGSVWAGLLPTVIALAIYFCFADFVLLSQVLYYNNLAQHRQRRAALVSASETTDANADPTQPLLAPRRRPSAASRRSSRSTANRRQSSTSRRDSLSALIEKRPSASTVLARNALAILGTCAAGTLGWVLAWQFGAWTARHDGGGGGEKQAMGAQILGYASAALYLGARIPQIIQNWRKKSTDGLSMLFFMLSLLGNITYGAGILFHSTEKQYVLDNLPWLLGSLGTMAEDAIIFAQFHMYKSEEEPAENTSAVV